MRRSLRILYISYPLLPVSPESCGGAEQILCTVEGAMHGRGHDTTVAACAGSRVAGELLATGSAPTRPDMLEERQAEHHAAILDFLAECQRQGRPVDLIHDHSGSFWPLALDLELPVLATLHLPRHFYPDRVFQQFGPNVSLNCVSTSQLQAFSGVQSIVGVVENGIDLGRFKLGQGERGDYLLWVGRICEEKGPHVALDVAARTGLPLVLLGMVYPFSYHQRYHEREIVPRLRLFGSWAQHTSSATLQQKVSLLQQARAVLIPSLAEETSSLVAMEAMACGAPVIGFRRGAIPEIVQDGVTGFLADSVEEMSECVNRAQEIDSNACRHRVELWFSAEHMCDEYEALYGRILQIAAGDVRLAA